PGACMSEEKPLCTVTHRQLTEGRCPWCHAPVSGGQLTGGPAGSAEARWEWAVLQEDLRAADLGGPRNCRRNPHELSEEVEEALPLLSFALEDRHEEVRFHGEQACGRMGKELSPNQATWLEDEVRDERHQLAARMMLLSSYFTSRERDLRAKRAAHIYWL